MRQKIEPGCLAIVKGSGSENDGTTVTVEYFVGNAAGLFKYQDLWGVDKRLYWYDGLGRRYEHKLCPERYLMRIDGYDSRDEAEEVQKEEDYYWGTGVSP